MYTGLLIMFILLALLVIVLAFKNHNTFEKQMIISNAIHRYHMDMCDRRVFDMLVDYKDMEPYNMTLLRIWDWGYKRILPPDKFEIIKPYIMM